MLFDGSEHFGACPESDEIEVTIIGPGYGEAVLVHIGDNKWICVDSCVCRGTSRPAPLMYLDAIGVAPSNVILVTASHWDDDHIRGMTELIKACENATFCASRALGSADFQAFAEAFSRPLTSVARPGTREARDAFTFLQTEGRKLKGAYPNSRIFGDTDLGLSHKTAIEIWTLSPTDEEYENFLRWALDQMPHTGETRRLATRRIRNDLSVVLLVTIGNDAVLLGGDLEEEGKSETGWSAVLLNSGRPTQRASVFKVAHHGSETGHHEGIWESLLAHETIAVVAPFKRGRISLPTQDDVTRITSKSASAYATISMAGRAPIRRARTVEKAIGETTKFFAAAPQIPGMVRLRRKLGDAMPWSVELFGGGCPLGKIFA